MHSRSPEPDDNASVPADARSPKTVTARAHLADVTRSSFAPLVRRLKKAYPPSLPSRHRRREGVPSTPGRKSSRTEPAASAPSQGITASLAVDVAVFVLPQTTPAPMLSATLAAHPARRRIVMSSDRVAEWGEEALPFEFFHIGKIDHVHNHLKQLGAIDTLVVAWPMTAEAHAKSMGRLIFHVRDKGRYVIPWRSVTDDPGILRQRLFDACTVVSGSEPPSTKAVDKEFFRAIAKVEFSREAATATKRGDHVLKLRDAETNRYLPQRSDVSIDELSTVKARPIRFAQSIDSYGDSGLVSPLFEEVDAPRLHLRHYTGRLGLVSHSLLFTDGAVLPDSFRHHLDPNPKNRRLHNSSYDFARLRAEDLPKVELDGAYYLLDSENSGHFGHLMTEVISRLWGWDQAKRDDPSVKALFRLRYKNERYPALEKTVFKAFGIADDDITWIDRPTWLTSVYAATPQFHNKKPHYVHPGIVDTWQRIRDGLPPSDVPTYERIFVSRSKELGARQCRNVDEVEARFASAGYQIVYPERFSLAEQAHLFREARVIAGFGGSAMFNAIFADKLEHMIVLNQTAYTARNEQLIALAHDAKLSYFWSRPEIEHPAGGWTWDAYRSAWSFDMQRYGKDLDDLLERA